MPVNTFVSFDHDDRQQMESFRALNTNPNHPLEFNDHSLKEPVKDSSGNSITYLPSDSRSQVIKDEILRKFNKCTKLVVLIGNDTHKSKWVEWEITAFYDEKKAKSGEFTWKRLRGMKLNQCETAIVPPALSGKSTQALLWDPKKLADWIDQNPDQ